MPAPQAEAVFYRCLNALMEPLVRAGFGSPGLLTPGLIVVETAGRRSGRVVSVTLLAWPMGGALVVSTVRGDRSQWVKNLTAYPATHYWRHGRRHPATAIVIQPEPRNGHAALRAPAYGLAVALHQAAACTGFTFAVLMPGADDGW